MSQPDFSPRNPPEKILANLQVVSARIELIDREIGEERPRALAQAVSRLLYHIEPHLNGVNSHTDTKLGADITALLVSSAAEFETAWNALRLGNVPAATRQGRVACEFVAVVVLSCIPRDHLARLPPKEAPIASALSKHPHWSVFELYEPRPVDADNPGDMEPALQATQFFKSFLYAAHEVVGYSKQNLESLSKYRRFVQHPYSHGTADLVSQHFSGFTEDSPRGGIFFSKDRLPRLIHEADQLIALAALCADILDWTSNVYLSRGRDA